MTSQLTNEYSNKSSGDAHLVYLVIQRDAHLMVYLVIHRVVICVYVPNVRQRNE